MNRRPRNPAWPFLLTGGLLVVIFAALVVSLRTTLRGQIRTAIINRSAAVLQPVALRQLAQRESAAGDPATLLAAVLESAQQADMLAVAVFDARGQTLKFAPASLLFAELPLEDYLRLLKTEPISRFHADFPLDHYFAGIGPASSSRPTPVLEVLLPLHGRDARKLLGFAQYYIDARSLAGELGAIDERVNRQTAATLAIGTALIALVLAGSYLRLHRAQLIIAERNERLVRANFELTLAAKVSALGQITSHLIHGLQGSVTGLRAVVAGREATADWEAAAGYTERMQVMIQETVALLGDQAAHASYELSGHELAAIMRQRNTAAAARKGVALRVDGGFDHGLDSHRGSLLCLVASNLIQNAIDAAAPGGNVTVHFREDAATATLTVSDDGPGITDITRLRLFQPGNSGRPGGSGLGLAISQLLARQIGAALTLASTSPTGTTFQLTLPLHVS